MWALITVIFLGLLLFFMFDNYSMYGEIQLLEAILQSMVALCCIGVMFMFLACMHYIMLSLDQHMHPQNLQLLEEGIQ